MIQASPPSQFLQTFENMRGTWFAAVQGPAQTLFGLLAVIEFAWSAAVLALERTDLQSWTAGLLRKIMWIGAFYALLVFGPTWIPAIIDSFTQLGQQASGTGPLQPGDVFQRGLNLGGALLGSASDAGFLANPGTALAMVFAAILSFVAFCFISIQLVAALVESYIVVAAAFVFLGFGGSRWSAPYVEKYIALTVGVGVKIMILYLLVGVGMAISSNWVAVAQALATSTAPAMGALDIMGESLIFLALCWFIPKVVGRGWCAGGSARIYRRRDSGGRNAHRLRRGDGSQGRRELGQQRVQCLGGSRSSGRRGGSYCIGRAGWTAGHK